MSVRRTRDMRRALTAKGFTQEKTHHEMYRLFVRGRRTSVRTRISHGEHEYGDSLQAQMAKQLRLHPDEFASLMDCPLSGEGHTRILVERGHIRVPDDT